MKCQVIPTARQSAFRHWRAVDLIGKRLFPSVTRMTWHFEINRRAKSRVSDWRQNRFLPRAFPRLRLQRFGPNPAVGRNRRLENRFGRKKRRVTRPCNSSTRAAHARKRAWTETGIVERRSRTLDAHLRGLHVRFPPPATRARRETTFRDRCRTTRHITSKNIGRDAWPPHAPRARRRPRRRNSRVFSSTVLSMPRSRRSRALAVSSSALIEGPFPPPHVSNFSIGRSGDSGCSVAHADTPLPSLVVPAA